MATEDQEWRQICESGQKWTNSTRWEEFGGKVNIGFCLKHFHYFKTWQDEIGSMPQTMWTNWGSYAHFLGTVQYFLGRNLGWALLSAKYPNWMEPDVFTPMTREKYVKDKIKMYLWKIILLVAKKISTKCCFEPFLPTIVQWRERTTKVYDMENPPPQMVCIWNEIWKKGTKFLVR